MGGGTGRAAAPITLYQEGQGGGGEGGLLIKGKYLLLIERIRVLVIIELYKLYDITNFCWKTVKNVWKSSLYDSSVVPICCYSNLRPSTNRKHFRAFAYV